MVADVIDSSGRLMRWRLPLLKFDFEVIYKKRRVNTQADALSRLPSHGKNEDPVDDEIPYFIADELHAKSAKRPDAHLSDEEDDNVVGGDYGACEELLALKGEAPDPVLYDSITPEELLRE